MSETFVRVKVSGGLACFSRPEMKVERVSYEVMTPSAARGILDAILWKPEMRWIIRRITVLKPIRYIGFRRNEVQSKIPPGSIKKWMSDPSSFIPQVAGAGTEDVTQRNTLALRDVAYLIEAEPRVFSKAPEDSPTKYMAMFNRRVENGQCHTQPCFGCREFPACFETADPGDKPIEEDLNLGLMLYDVAYDPSGSNHRPIFFHANLTNGVLDTHPDRVLPDPVQREEVLKCSYRH